MPDAEGLRGGRVHGAGGRGHELPEGCKRRDGDRQEYAHLRPDEARGYGETYSYFYTLYTFYTLYAFYPDAVGNNIGNYRDGTEDLHYSYCDDSYLYT